MKSPLIFLLAFLTSLSLARSADLATRGLTLNQCVQLALQHNYDIQIERLTPTIARFDLSGSYGVYEPSFNFSAGDRFLNQPSGFDAKKSGIDFPYELTTDSVGAGISGRLPTGLSYDFQANSSYQQALTDFNLLPTTAGLFRPDGIRHTNQFSATAGITLRQPLLKDFWIDAYRQKIRVNAKNLKISEMGLRWQVMNTVNAVQQTYYDLVFAREKVRAEEHALELANRLLEETRKRVRVGDLAELAEKQIQSQVETLHTDLFSSEQAFSHQQNALKRLMTDDFRAWADVAIDPVEGLIAVPEIFDRTESWRNALGGRPDLVQARLELERQGIIVRYHYNQLFPSLDLVGGYGVQGGAGSFSESLGNIRDQTYPQYAYGVTLSFPLGNRTARNSYKATQTLQQQAALKLKKMEQDALVQVDDSLKLAQSDYRRTISSREARVYAEAALKVEERKLQEGLSTPFFVLQFQQKLTDARTIEIRALADYNKGLAQLALNEGTTMEKNHLVVDLK